LSHFHLDHIIGLHILNKFQFAVGLKIFGQKGTEKILNCFVNAPFTVPFSQLPYPVEIHELSEGVHRIPFSMECRQLLHSSPCYGFRLNIDGKIITYCTDTGICDNLIHLGNLADLIITECSNIRGQYNESWPHLSPENIVDIVNRTQAKQIAIIHFDAHNYRSIDERFKIGGYFPEIKDKLIISSDNLELVI
jgi:ribonuclease BN (tRNA processing enzyme)